ncbi:hypothetical protein ACHHYP_01021 [Achlya hypogyna]|uniref:Secreted protein n=1 Tax=Achlya hypogyna TaxID=1202772 RepID=A0A0A7CN19_ACHHY|nr:secreted protein [Achlya hypogyna]OQR94654.1 hypothetical protein ACHHYP_01021 [Achlya hypogyna]
MRFIDSIVLAVVSLVCVSANSPAYNATPATLESCKVPVPETCGFYRSCLEAAHPCGPQGYALGFGEFYCNKFAAYKDSFSPKGKAWMYNTMTCLQKKLGASLSDPAISCNAIKTFAFDSHPECYTANGGPSVCDLNPLKDWTTVLRVVGLKTLLKIDTIKNGASTGIVCLKELLSWASVAAKAVGTPDEYPEPMDWM